MKLTCMPAHAHIVARRSILVHGRIMAVEAFVAAVETRRVVVHAWTKDEIHPSRRRISEVRRWDEAWQIQLIGLSRAGASGSSLHALNPGRSFLVFETDSTEPNCTPKHQLWFRM